MHKKSIANIILGNVCISNLLSSLYVAMVIVILPSLFISSTELMLDNSYDRTLMYSITMAATPMSAMLGMMFFPAFSEYKGYSLMMIYGFLISLFSDVVGLAALFLHNPWIFVFSRIISGLCYGVTATSMALLNDVNKTKKQKNRALKLTILVGSIGGILGSSSILLFKHSILPYTNISLSHVVFSLAIIFDIINIIIFCYCHNILRTEANIVVNNVTTKLKFRELMESILFMFKHPTARYLIIIYITFRFGVGLIAQGLPMYIAINYHYQPEDFSYFYLVLAIIGLIGLYVVEPLIAKFIKNKNTLLNVCLIILSIEFIFEFLRGVKHMMLDNKFGFHGMHAVWVVAILFSLIVPISRLGWYEFFRTSVPDNKQNYAVATISQWTQLAGIISGISLNFLIHRHEVLIVAGFACLISYLLLKTYNKLIANKATT